MSRHGGKKVTSMKARRRYCILTRMISLLAVLCALCCGSNERTQQSQSPNVLLIVLDTVRADRIGCYGAAGNPTPTIDSLATSGVKFSNAISQSSWTKPSFAALLTGLYPYHIPQEEKSIASKNVTLAEHLKAHGYFTIGAATNIFLQRAYGMHQGFDVYLDSFPPGARSFPEALVELEPWLDRLNEVTPFFLFVQIFEPHFPYKPPEPYASRFAVGETRFPNLYKDINKGRISKKDVRENAIGMDEADIAHFAGLYQGEIAYADFFVRSLCHRLRSLNLANSTLIVITADHGEAFGENNYYFEHSKYLSHDQVHVPLIFSLPGVISRGHEIIEAVPMFSIFPTVLDLLGVPSGELDGTIEAPSLAHYVLGDAKTPDDLPVFTMSGPKLSIIRDGWRLERNSTTKEQMLYHLPTDPIEENNLSGAPAVARIESVLANDLKMFRRHHMITSSLPDVAVGLSKSEREALVALGYLDDQ